MSKEQRSRSPCRKWLLSLVVALLVAATLLVRPWRMPLPRPVPSAVQVGITSSPAVAQEPGAAAAPLPAPAAALPLTPVTRTASALVAAEDWLGLARTFSAERALAGITALSAPEFGGRQAGSSGGGRAADYIAGRFAALGLQPGSPGGGYRQEFTLPFVEYLSTPRLTLIAANGDERPAQLHRDFEPIVSSYTGSGTVEGPLVWVNRGAHRDYDGLDPSGAIVVCREPAKDVYRQAAEHRAGGLLILCDDARVLEMRHVVADTSWISETFPAAYISPDALRFLLAGSSFSLDDLSIQYTPQHLGARARLEVAVRQVEHAPAQNVLAVLPGRDLARRHEIVVLGAHYDHLGQEPSDALFAGANDDASGVAALIEIARSWQAAGYVPERTVLFATWDAEEEGLLGSQYYVHHPSFPLTQTVAMLQLDMVGRGQKPILLLDGSDSVREQALVSAGELGIQAQAAQVGRSDHVSFQEGGVPGLMLIWAGIDDDPTYHRPGDLPANINPDYLRQAGTLAELVALRLSSTEPALAGVIAGQREALRHGDLAAYLAGVSIGEQAPERDRLASWALGNPQEVDLSLQELIAASGVATATLRLSYLAGPDRSPHEASYPARYVREQGAWRYAGLAGVTEAGACVQLLVAAGTPGEAGLLPQADSLYCQLRQVLVLPSGPPVTLELYPRPADYQVLHGVSPGQPAYRTAGDHGTLAEPSAITETLVSLVLGEAGLPPGRLPWLPAGLAAVLATHTPEEIARSLPLASHARDLAPASGQLWPLASLPAPAQVAPDRLPLWRAEAESLTLYLLRQGGWPAVAALARAAGASPDLDAACRQALGYSLGDFEARWRRAEIERWQEVSQAISDTLRLRGQAVAAHDRTAFLSTVNSANPTWRAEQEHWFEDTLTHPLATYAETGVLEELAGDRALVMLTQELQPAGDSVPSRLTQRVRFVAQDGRWLYDDLDLQVRASTHFTVCYDPASRLAPDFLDTLLAAAERAWSADRADWPATPAKTVLKLYPNGESFRLSIYPSMPSWATGWTEPGESIKLNVPRLADPGGVIAHELAHQALFAMGVEDAWLHEGIATVARQEYDPRVFGAFLLKRRRELGEALRTNQALDLLTLASWRDVEEERVSLLYTQSWDTVAYLRRRFGQAALLQVLERRGQGSSLSQAFLEVTGRDLPTLLADWHRSALADHFDPEILALAKGFDEWRAFATASRLSGREFAGRAAGSAGAEAAARFVAERFQACGLLPAGDGGSYRQEFPITYTALLTTPLVSFTQPDGRPITILRYRQDYREFVRGYAGEGTAEGEVVWVAEDEYGDAHLGGRIVLQRLRGDHMDAAAKAARAGAGGLILISDSSQDWRLRSLYLPALEAATIPVVEISNDTFVDLIKRSGHGMLELSTGQPILRLGFRCRMVVPLVVEPGRRTANVLALLPGRDERLEHELVIVGAHYDHVGSLPDGTLYPGANDDASGVAVLLELARLLQSSGYQPHRSILFAAWGAEEEGLLGSTYYVNHPWAPLTATVAMVQLDMVGQGRGYYLNLAGDQELAGELMATLALGAEQLDLRASVLGPTGASDHAPFQERSVPAALLTWREGENAHLPDDTADLIDPHKLATAGQLTAATLAMLAGS